MIKIGLTIVLGLLAPIAAPLAAATPAEDTRPNIVLITTDDMTDYDLRWMPQTRALIRRQGFELTDFISPHPLCCPARAEMLTGQYAHNNGVHHNKGAWGGTALVDPDNNIGRWVQDAGYQTAFVGKFLNHFDAVPIAGWDHFNNSVSGIYAAYGFEYAEEPNRIEDEYTADYVGRKTIDYVREFADKGPFFIWSSQMAPHGMTTPEGKWVDAIPADRHRLLYPKAMPPSLSKPSFNEPNVTDKPRYLRVEPVGRQKVIDRFRNRIRSLKSVDEQVGNLVAALDELGELDNTVIMFTSDNGYLLGEHRLIGKNYPYEEALQVPFLISGPGVPVGSSQEPATLVDVAPTIADLADAAPQRVQDGTSMMPVIGGDQRAASTLIQAGDDFEEWLFRGVRDPRWTYAEHSSGEVELYDRNSDPYQLTNLDGRRSRKQAQLAARLEYLRDCVGPACYGAGPQNTAER